VVRDKQALNTYESIGKQKLKDRGSDDITDPELILLIGGAIEDHYDRRQ